MNASRPDRLFDLLPAVYRVSDAARGDVLQALIGVIQEEFERLEGDVERLYDNWFVETCDEWVVPYIGDLLGVTGLYPATDGVFSQRGFVANTLAHRRAKGTAAVLEQLAFDVTGWRAKAVEYFDLLATARWMNHSRRSDVSTVAVRDANLAELVGSPLEQAAHTAEVRHVDNRRGRYNIPNVGLHLWRLQPYYLAQATARPVGMQGGRASRFILHPVGLSMPLFNVVREETSALQLAAEENLPGRLRHRPLHDELEARRQARVDGEEPEERYFDDRQPVIRVRIDREASGSTFFDEVEPEELVVCDLSDRPAPGRGWRRPPSQRFYQPRRGGPKKSVKIKAAVDPVLGRLALPAGDTSRNVEVTYAYGFPGDLGGGPYSRQASVAEVLAGSTVGWQLGVGTPNPTDELCPSLRQAVEVWNKLGTLPPGGADELCPSLRQAVEVWNELGPDDIGPGEVGVIAVLDSRTYREDLTIEVKAGRRLLIVAADWPVDVDPDAHARAKRSYGRLTADGRRPHLRGRIQVQGTAPAGTSPGGLVIDGLLVERGLTVLPGNLGQLRLSHCTLVPFRGRLLVRSDAAVAKQNNELRVTIQRSITGPLQVDQRVARLQVWESIVDGRGGGGIVGPAAEIQASTVLGRTGVVTLSASNSIFTGPVAVERRQTGCVRYSYLPSTSKVPRRFSCQPAEDATAHVAPAFTSTRYGDPAYGQLAETCPPEITGGADDEAELGAFHFLQQPKRVAGLTTRLDEYLRFGLEAGVFFVT